MRAPEKVPLLRVLDALCEGRVRFGNGLRRVRRAAAQQEAVRVLIVGIEVPSRPAEIQRVMSQLVHSSRHRVTLSVTPMLDQGKFANIDKAIAEAPVPLDQHDWLIIADDDIVFQPGMLDDLLAIANEADFALAQTAHAFDSHTTYQITRRRFGSLARRTDFVEIGPLTLIRRDLFPALIPFPPSRWCYGIDLVWAEIARRLGYHIGVIDGAPVRHVRPVGASYDMDAARREGALLLAAHGVSIGRIELFSRNEVVLPA